MPRSETHLAVVSRAAALWPQLVDSVPPRAMRVVTGSADKLVASIDGQVTVDYVAGLLTGASLESKTREERQKLDPLGKALDQLRPDKGGGEASLVFCYLAHRIVAGDLVP